MQPVCVACQKWCTALFNNIYDNFKANGVYVWATNTTLLLLVYNTNLLMLAPCGRRLDMLLKSRETIRTVASSSDNDNTSPIGMLISVSSCCMGEYLSRTAWLPFSSSTTNTTLKELWVCYCIPPPMHAAQLSHKVSMYVAIVYFKYHSWSLVLLVSKSTALVMRKLTEKYYHRK